MQMVDTSYTQGMESDLQGTPTKHAYTHRQVMSQVVRTSMKKRMSLASKVCIHMPILV